MLLVVGEQDSACSLISAITISSKARGMSFFHTRHFRLTETFAGKHFPVSPMKIVYHWSHTFKVTIHETLSAVGPETKGRKGKRKKRDEIVQNFLRYLQMQ